MCGWHGVQCYFVDGNIQRPIVTGLSLEMNNLRGKAGYDAGQSRNTEPQDNVEGVHSSSLTKALTKQKSE